jgi:hypothetical protein
MEQSSRSISSVGGMSISTLFSFSDVVSQNDEGCHQSSIFAALQNSSKTGALIVFCSRKLLRELKCISLFIKRYVVRPMMGLCHPWHYSGPRSIKYEAYTAFPQVTGASPLDSMHTQVSSSSSHGNPGSLTCSNSANT